MARRMFANLEEILAVVLVSAMTLVVTLQVFARLVLRSPLAWTEELAIILFVWVTMVGSSLALKKGEHFAVEILHRKLPAGALCWAKALVALLLILFSSIMFYEGFGFAARNVSVRTPAMEIPRAIPYAALPAGGALMLIRSCEMLFAAFRRPEPQGGAA